MTKQSLTARIGSLALGAMRGRPPQCSSPFPGVVMSDLFPFLTVGGNISWWAVLGFALAVLVLLWIARKVPFLRQVAG